MDLDTRRLEAARGLAELLGSRAKLSLAIRLWDGSRVAWSAPGEPGFELAVSHAGALGALLRWPSFDHLVRRFASGDLALVRGEWLGFGDALRAVRIDRSVSAGEAAHVLRLAWPLLLARSARGSTAPRNRVGGAHADPLHAARDVAFHYDLPAEFFALFLDSAMQYSCAYFAPGVQTLEAAQRAKLEMICRKLRLRPGDHLLDLGCGWGGLVCHAAREVEAEALGVTLSRVQAEYARTRIAALGLETRARVALRDFRAHDGERFDRVASVGLAEHVGPRGLPEYFASVRAQIADDGVFLHHAITHRARARRRGRASRDTRLARRYLLPGLELADLGATIAALERADFEVADVEGLRSHYARTAREWAARLEARRDEAVRLVGAERYRLCLLCLAGMAWSFEDASNGIFQIVATVRRKRVPSPLPATRDDLYAR